MVGVTEGEKWRELKSVPVDVPAGQPLVLEFSAVGNLLTVLLNGKPAIEVQDATYSYGSPGLAAGDGATVFKDVQVNAARGKNQNWPRLQRSRQHPSPLRLLPNLPFPRGICQRTRHRPPSPRSMRPRPRSIRRLGPSTSACRSR